MARHLRPMNAESEDITLPHQRILTGRSPGGGREGQGIAGTEPAGLGGQMLWRRNQSADVPVAYTGVLDLRGGLEIGWTAPEAAPRAEAPVRRPVDELAVVPDPVRGRPDADQPDPVDGLAMPGLGPALRRRRWALYLVSIDALAFLLTGALTQGLSWAQAIWAVATIAAFRVLGLYRQRLNLSALDDLPELALGVLFTGAMVGMLGHSHVAGGFGDLGLVGLGFGLLAVIAARIPAYALIRQARRAGVLLQPVLIVGAGEIGSRLAQNLLSDRSHGLYPVGFLEREPRSCDVGALHVPVLGTPDELRDWVRRLHVARVIVAFGYQREVELVDVLRTCDRLSCEIFYVPRLFELHNVTRHVDSVLGIPLVRIRRAAFRTVSWQLKRLFDLVLSGAALLALAPVMAACALAVRVKLGSGVLFRQERVGLDGRPFHVLKFRSLRPATELEADTTWNIAHDDRLTPLGRFLRRTSLDELPQFWNVFTGDMSLVGPRPERPHFVTEFSTRIPRYTGRHRVPAGLTGWAQVNGLRGDTSLEERARFDNYYIENWSLWLDVKIMLRTIGEVLARRGG